MTEYEYYLRFINVEQERDDMSRHLSRDSTWKRERWIIGRLNRCVGSDVFDDVGSR